MIFTISLLNSLKGVIPDETLNQALRECLSAQAIFVRTAEFKPINFPAEDRPRCLIREINLYPGASNS